VRKNPFRGRWALGLFAAPIALAALALRGPLPAAAPAAPPAIPVAEAAAPAESSERGASNALPVSQPNALPAAQTEPTAAPTAPAPTATPVPTAGPNSTPTPRPAGWTPRVGIQVGHWKSNELPEELKRLRTSTGAFAGGYREADVNLDIARRVAKLLESRGLIVEILPATIPPDYDADAFVSIHADGSSSTRSRGFKLATPWRTSRAAQHLLEALTAEYAAATGLPQDGAITSNMRGYYAFNYRRHDHAVARTTPAVILEMGFLTNAADRAMMVNHGDVLAVGIANGIIRYLNERDPNDGAALLTPEFRNQRAASESGVDVRAAPRDDARVLTHVGADRSLSVFQERDGWYQVFVRGTNGRVQGWVRKDQVIPSNDPTPTPPPSTDS
jgi:N-acetylmuramoyl-L-alanine amidase